MSIVLTRPHPLRLETVAALMVAFVLLRILPHAVDAQAEDASVLARVEVAGPVATFGLPVRALLQDASGRDYLLVVSTSPRLVTAGWPYRIIDSPAQAEDYLLAQERRPGAKARAAGRFAVLHDDGVQWLLRATSDDAQTLGEMGFAIQRLGQKSMVWPKPVRTSLESEHPSALLVSSIPDPLVAAMVQNVRSTNLYFLTSRLTGEVPVLADGSVSVIASRSTRSSSNIQSAVQFVSERLLALGLEVSHHEWSTSGASGRNVIATQPGGVLSNELVLITAHLDDMPSSGRAPGADDNASGSVAVLTAASIFSQHRFDRTVRFILFTGEEQGLLGSAAYAIATAAAGDNIVAVLNLDMIAWDGYGEPVAKLFTRTSSSPGYSSDMVLATLFTNVVASYGMSASLDPVIVSNGMGYSDHDSFWRSGYPAILAIEDYASDFTPHYHTTSDALATLNMAYFTAFTRAAVATLAHLAWPVGRMSREAIEVAASDWTPESRIGAGVFYAGHIEGAAEYGGNSDDVAWSNTATNPNPQWLKVCTEPYGVELKTDLRPVGSETLFRGRLKAVDTTGTGVSCPLRLRFDFLTPPEPDRIYTVRIQVDRQFTQQPNHFIYVANLWEVIEAGGDVNLPSLTTVGNGVVFGTCDLAARFLDTNSARCRLTLLSVAEPAVVLASTAQIGTKVCDDLELTTTLEPGSPWVILSSFTNTVAPDASSFEGGWTEITRSISKSSLPIGPDYYFRLKRNVATH